jgi:hypothetical protein
MKTICDAPSIWMPSTRVRVVCTLGETIDTLVPTIWLISVDLPTLGAPNTATNRNAKAAHHIAPPAGQQGAGRRLFGRPLGGPFGHFRRWPSMDTSTLKSGACGGPSRPTSR